jgi:hypothetical protein
MFSPACTGWENEETVELKFGELRRSNGAPTSFVHTAIACGV